MYTTFRSLTVNFLIVVEPRTVKLLSEISETAVLKVRFGQFMKRGRIGHISRKWAAASGRQKFTNSLKSLFVSFETILTSPPCPGGRSRNGTFSISVFIIFVGEDACHRLTQLVGQAALRVALLEFLKFLNAPSKLVHNCRLTSEFGFEKKIKTCSKIALSTSWVWSNQNSVVKKSAC